MRSVLRWLGYALGGVAAIALLAVTAVYALSARDMKRSYAVPESPVRAATDTAEIARGEHIVAAIAKCQDCHGDDFGGQQMMDDPVFARLWASNITTGEGGIAGYTDADWERALRHGVGRDGRSLVFMPAEAYQTMSDEDLAAVIGYLRTIEPVDRATPDPSVGPIARALYLAGKFPLLPADLVNHESRPPKPAEGVTAAYGGYLAAIGGCAACHGAALAGTGEPNAPDITRSGVTAEWTEEDFFRALRHGKRPDGSVIDGSMMPWARSGQMTDDEIRALWMYIRSLPGRPAES